MWQHNYEPLGGSLALSALVAAIPILGAVPDARRAAQAGVDVGAGGAGVGAASSRSSAYGMPAKLAIISTLYGAAYGLFPIAWVVFSSIMLYRLAVDTGKFEIIKDSVGSLTDDRRLQAMFIAFSFGAFIEGAAGFGAPVAVAGRDARRPRLRSVLRRRHLPARQYRAGRVRIDRHSGRHAGQRHRPAGACAQRDGRPAVRDDLGVHSRLPDRRHGRAGSARSRCCRRSSRAACRSPACSFSSPTTSAPNSPTSSAR